jgi:hypothetical protein
MHLASALSLPVKPEGDSFAVLPDPLSSSRDNRYQLNDVVCDVGKTSVTSINPGCHGFALKRSAFSPF